MINNIIEHGSVVRYKADGRFCRKRIRPARDLYDKYMIEPESPIGIAMMGKQIGDVFDVETPGGTKRIEIIAIGR